MINFVSAEEFGKKQLDSIDFLLKFNESEINKTQFLFVKEQLTNYYRYINSEYKIKLDTKYNNSKKKSIQNLLLQFLIASYHIMMKN